MKNRLFAIIVLCSVLCFVVRYGSFVVPSTVGAVSSCFLYPVLRLQNLFIDPLHSWVTSCISAVQLHNKYALLQKEYDTVLAENIALKGMCSYHDSVADLLLFKKRYSRNNEHVVKVLARHFSDYNQFFLVNAGTYHGIEKDMIALYGNCLIGRVEQVYPWYCKVCLITDAACKVGIVCSKTGALGIHEGMNNGAETAVRHVSHLKTVELNDMVLSSGEGLIFPQGFGLGSIVSVEKGDLFYTIRVKPLVDFNEIHYCTLMAKGDSETIGG